MRTTALIVAGLALVLLSAADASAFNTAATRVRGAPVCFTVNNLGDPIASTVRGTLFRSRKRLHSRPTALLLQHGAVAERSAWSGGAGARTCSEGAPATPAKRVPRPS